MPHASAESAPLERTRIRCPRCGYDLRGVMATWAESCPMRGVCSECGLEFAWGPVIHPEKFEPRWCVEFAKSVLGYGRCTLRTLARSFLPWRFWRDLKMSDSIRWGRLLTYVLILLMLLPLSYAIEQAAVATRVYAFMRAEVQVQAAEARQEVAALQARAANAGADGTNALNSNERRWLQFMQGRLPVQPAVDFALHEAILEAVLHPRRTTSNGTVIGVYGTVSYPAPQVIHVTTYSMNRTWSGPRPLRYVREGTWKWIAAGLIVAVGIPVGFVFLPISRAKAKVRWSHVVRIALYSVIVPVAVLTLFGLVIGAHFSIDAVRDPLSPLMFWLAQWPMLIGLNVWWIFAIGRYLKIPHGWAVAPVLSLLSVLVVASVTYLLAPELLIDV